MKSSLFFISVISIFLASCKFDYSPYDAVPVSSSSQLSTETNLKRIHELSVVDSTSIKIAVIDRKSVV